VNIQSGQRTCILVLGMHRSGTSAITRVLSLLGAALPRNMLGAQAGNDAGHWEPARLLVLNDELLQSAGSSWDDWRQLTLDTLPEDAKLEYQRKVREIIADEYGDANLLVLKDPRICRFAPFFADILRGTGLNVRYVIPLRQPPAVAASLFKRNGMSNDFSDLLYLRHVLDAEATTRSADRLIVDYDELLDDPKTTSDRVASWLLKGTNQDAAAAIEAAMASIDNSLRHEQSIESQDRLSPADRTYRLLRELSPGRDGQAPKELDRLRAVLDLTTPFVSATVNHVTGGPHAAGLPGRSPSAQSQLVGPFRALDEWGSLLAQISETRQQLSEAAAAALSAQREHLIKLEESRIELAEAAKAAAEYKRRHHAARDRARAAEATVARLEREKGDALFERDRAHEAANALRKSLSWRITAPVRLVTRLARGETTAVAIGVGNALRRVSSWLPAPFRNLLRDISRWITGRVFGLGNSPANYRAIQNIIVERNTDGSKPSTSKGAAAPIDISAVVYNDRRWLQKFADSVVALDYPKNLLGLTFVDNGSTDGSKELLETIAEQLRQLGVSVSILHRPNNGYGAGHNAGIAEGRAEFVLVTNVDLEFERDAISAVVSTAISDSPQVAAWELRQLPFEHPKYYDPVVGLTNWNSHACVLMRRSALSAVGGYDESIFMYGEDVELSYRLRREGYLLRYVPRAAVSHYSFESIDDVKPLQFSGSTLSNFYLRLKYGTASDILAAPMLLVGLAMTRGLPKTLKAAAWSNVRKAPRTAWRALSSRRKSKVSFPFRRWDFEMIRDGAGITSKVVRTPELVSVITRTVKGREALLRQAVGSVWNQTYGAIEHIIVQDGGSDVEAALGALPKREGLTVRFVGLDKVGRSAAGNAGLRAARGKWCVFLDDDDLLFADHLEVLVGAVEQNQTKAAYTLAWEVPTVFTSNGASTSYEELSHNIPDVLRQDFDHAVLRHHNFLPIQSVLFERSLFEERGGLEEDMHALEDWVLWNKYAVGNSFKFVRKTTSLYRVPASSDSAISRIGVLTDAYPTALSRIALNEERYAPDDED
jgi:GT2 family glycosyltransferase